MGSLFVAILICFLSVGLSANTVKIGLLPGGNPQVIEKESYFLADKLQKKINQPVHVHISKDYGGVIDALKRKKIDFAILTSLTYVEAEKELDLKVLLKKTWSNGPFYYSSIVVRADSKIKTVKDLAGKSIAFVDEKSTSGYLYPQVYLRKNKISNSSFSSIQFTGNHAASVQLLENKKVDAIAVFSDDEKGSLGAWRRFSKTKNFKVRVLWISDPIPNDPIVVRKEYYDLNTKLTHEIMYTLIEIRNEYKEEIGEILGSSELMPATSRQYDPVREMLKIFEAVTN